MLLSLKSLRFKVTSAFLSVIILLVITLIFSCRLPANDAYAVFSRDDAKSFLGGFGWSVCDESAQRSFCEISDKNAAVFENYNAIQLAQGFDLRNYIGQTVEKYVFDITNYDGVGENTPVKATVLVSGGRVIGGDIATVGLSGFMHGFAKPVSP